MDGVHNYAMKTHATNSLSGSESMASLAAAMNDLVSQCKVNLSYFTLALSEDHDLHIRMFRSSVLSWRITIMQEWVSLNLALPMSLGTYNRIV